MPSADYKVEIVNSSGEADMSVSIVGDQVVDLTGATDGQVLTVQSDGTVAPESPAADPAAVPKSLYDANTVLKADTDNTPAALTMEASTILARLAAGSIKAATPAEIKTLLAIAEADVTGLVGDLAAKVAKAGFPVEFGVALSDVATPLVVGNTKAGFRVPYAFTLTAVRASLITASGGGTLVTVDILKNGTSVLSTALTIDNGELTSLTAATPAVIGTSAFADDDIVRFDITQAGSGAAGLRVWLLGTRTLP